MPVTCRSLEIHATHACNLACESCSHGSNFNIGKTLTYTEVLKSMLPWRGRLNPERFAILGGEPTLNKDLCDIIRLARTFFIHSDLLLVTNGWYLHKHPALPQVLQDTRCRMDVSVHHTSEEYTAKVAEAKALTDSWQRRYHELDIRYRPSSTTWRRSYDTDANGQPVPYQDNDTIASWGSCYAKWCPQILDGKLYKCPQMAYWPMMVEKLQLPKSQWGDCLSYTPLTPDCTDAELDEFMHREVEPVCAACPAYSRSFQLPSPIPSTSS